MCAITMRENLVSVGLYAKQCPVGHLASPPNAHPRPPGEVVGVVAVTSLLFLFV